MRWVIFILLLSGAWLPCVADDAPLQKTVLAALGANDAAMAAASFHYPPGQTQAARDRDQRGVGALLAAVLDVTGAVDHPVLASAPANSLDIAVGGGDADYWHAHPLFERYTYHVEFKHYGAGLVKIDIVTIAGQPALRSVVLGLAAERADAKALMAALMGRVEPIAKHLSEDGS